jgi:hypothetical protein
VKDHRYHLEEHLGLLSVVQGLAVLFGTAIAAEIHAFRKVEHVVVSLLAVLYATGFGHFAFS